MPNCQTHFFFQRRSALMVIEVPHPLAEIGRIFFPLLVRALCSLLYDFSFYVVGRCMFFISFYCSVFYHCTWLLNFEQLLAVSRCALECCDPTCPLGPLSVSPSDVFFLFIIKKFLSKSSRLIVPSAVAKPWEIVKEE